jgi:nucleotide-binding universal stress UspA family protein
MLPAKIILHPTDFSEPASQAHAVACALARDWNAQLIVLHVADKPVISYIEKASDLPPDEFQCKLWETLQCPKEVEKGVNVDHRVVEGHPVQQILQVAREVQADLIVLGTHGHRGLLHWFKTNITDHIVRDAHCSVLIERSSMYEEPAPMPEETTPVPDENAPTPEKTDVAPPLQDVSAG